MAQTLTTQTEFMPQLTRNQTIVAAAASTDIVEIRDSTSMPSELKSMIEQLSQQARQQMQEPKRPSSDTFHIARYFQR